MDEHDGPGRWGALPVAAARLQGARLQVLLSLAAWARKDGTVTGHGVGGIRKDTGLGERTVRRALQDLGAEGWLTATPGAGAERTFYTLHRHPLTKPRPATRTRGEGVCGPGGRGSTDPDKQSADLQIPPGGERDSVPPPGHQFEHQEDAMTAAHVDEDQLGLELEVEPTPSKAKPRKDGGPAARVVAAYCKAYVEAHQQQPASERGRVAGQVQALLRSGHTEEELTAAVTALGRTRFTYVAEELRRVRDDASRHQVEGWGKVAPRETAPAGGQRVEGW